MKHKSTSLIHLPQKSDVWFLSLRELTLEQNGKNIKGALLLLVELNQDEVLRMDVYDSMPEPDFVRGQVWITMSRPELKSQSPHRPSAILFEQPELWNELAPALEEIQVRSQPGEAPPIVDALIQSLRLSLDNVPQELPGLLSVPGATPKMIARFFDAAAFFYRAAAWEHLMDTQTLSVTIDPPGQQLYIQVMGNGGIEFGLTCYNSWEDVLRVYEAANSPMELLPENGIHGLTYVDRDEMPSEDQSGMQKFHWITAGRNACPLPVTFTKTGEAERPTRQELLYFEALMRALPEFIEQYLVEHEAGDYQPVEVTIETLHFDGPVRLTIRYPAGELPDLVEGGINFDEDEETFELPKSLIEANRLAGRAWDIAGGEDRLHLAHQALALSPDCVEAYLVLANESETLEEAQVWLEKAVQAGKRVLTEGLIEKNQGDLWHWREARPYLRAIDGLAENLEALGDAEEALNQYVALLRLNEEDHQGARYNALRLMIQMQRDLEAQDLIDEYKEDGSATWAYSKALIAFRQRGEQGSSRKALTRAIRTNQHVIAYLTGAKPLPAEEPKAIGFGDDSEAIQYALEHYPLWWSTPGAVDWLKKYQ